MITHVIVELKHPVKEEYFPMSTVLPSQYYGFGTPLVLCKDCKWWRDTDHTCHEHSLTSPMGAHEFCSRGERKE